MTPSDGKKLNVDLVLCKLFKQSREKKSTVKFQVGDRVRITSYKYTFSNKYDSNWTREIFIITDILKTRPVNYKIKDLNGEQTVGTFYNEELQNKLPFRGVMLQS